MDDPLTLPNDRIKSNDLLDSWRVNATTSTYRLPPKTYVLRFLQENCSICVTTLTVQKPTTLKMPQIPPKNSWKNQNLQQCFNATCWFKSKICWVDLFSNLSRIHKLRQLTSERTRGNQTICPPPTLHGSYLMVFVNNCPPLNNKHEKTFCPHSWQTNIHFYVTKERFYEHNRDLLPTERKTKLPCVSAI